jgi:hypothetical protein
MATSEDPRSCLVHPLPVTPGRIALQLSPSYLSRMRITTALILMCCLSGAVAAADAKIGDVPLRLPQPAGYCEMDPVLASDAPLIGRLHATMTKTGNRLLVISADCAELKDWRNGERPDLDHMAQYQTILELENEPLPDTPEKMIKNYCANMHGLAGRLSGATGAQSVEARAEEASRFLDLKEIKLLGVVGEEPAVCYAATLQKFKVDTQEATTQMAIIATTLIKGKVVQLYLFAPYTGHATIAQLLAQQRTNMGRLQRANRN